MKSSSSSLATNSAFMNLLLIGASRFALRRVLPAVADLDGIDGVDIATSRPGALTKKVVPKLGRVFENWDEALNTVSPGLVYVSVPNGLHALAVGRALEQGHHVVVDKPAFTDLGTAEELVGLAEASALVLAEATCYAFHPLFPAVTNIMADLGAQATAALAVFTPPVPITDWRWDRCSGGGAILDTGPYAVSLGRVLWGTAPVELRALVHDRTPKSLETSYSMLAGYPGGRAVVGHFGFTSAYQNAVRLTGKDFSIDIERPFSAPPDLAVGIHVQAADQSYVHTVDPCDSMQEFLSAVLSAVAQASADFGQALLADARAMARLRAAATSSAGGIAAAHESS